MDKAGEVVRFRKYCALISLVEFRLSYTASGLLKIGLVRGVRLAPFVGLFRFRFSCFFFSIFPSVFRVGTKMLPSLQRRRLIALRCSGALAERCRRIRVRQA